MDIRVLKNGSSVLKIEMPIIIMILLIIPVNASAVNSFCVAGPQSERWHNDHAFSVRSANEELNDYFNNNGQQHLLYQNGRSAAETIMIFQQTQPQHYISHIHGLASWILRAGHNWDPPEDLRSDEFNNNIFIGGKAKSNINFAGAPFSAILLMACTSGLWSVGNTWSRTFNDNLRCWIFVGDGGDESTVSNRDFIVYYSDYITDGFKNNQGHRQAASYDEAVHRALNKVQSVNRDYDIVFRTQNGGPLNHDSAIDCYRDINRVESCEGQLLLDPGDIKWLTYNNPNPYRLGGNLLSNGAYVVFHGVIDNNLQDIDTGRIIMNIYLDGPRFRQDIYEVRNHQLALNGQPVAYGGSDICSSFIPANLLRSTGRVDVSIDFIANNPLTCNNVMIDRFELMQIAT